MRKVRADFKAYSDAKEKESGEQKKALAEAAKARDDVIQELGAFHEDNAALKKELDARPQEEDVLTTFRGTPAYYGKLNNKIFEKVNLCWDIASVYLAENPGGNGWVFGALFGGGAPTREC